MIKKAMKAFGLTALLLGLSLGYTSCSDDPDPATKPKTEQKDEAEVATVELTLAEGHFHGNLFHQNGSVKGEKYLKAIQKMTLVRKDGKWDFADGSQKAFYVKAGNHDDPTTAENEEKNSAYGLWISYKDKDGNVITQNFIENNADKQHQHFFTAADVVPFGAAAPSATAVNTQDMFSYNYMDTTPWDKTLKTGATLNGESNRIGFKGWFCFFKDRTALTVKVRLVHAAQGKTVAPYYGSVAMLQNPVEVSFDIPFRVMFNNAEGQDLEGGATVADLNANDLNVVRAIAAAYGISEEEALAAITLRVEGEVEDVESSGNSLWF